MRFSVLMSVYEKEKADNLEMALKSVLIEQTVKPDQMVLVEDGPLTDELYEVIDRYKNLFPVLLNVIRLNQNCGLGKALDEGMKHCKYELIARMDSDDVCAKERFEKQLFFLKNNPEVAVCGGNIAEFYETPSNMISVRKVPAKHCDIVERMKLRNPMNHVTVMLRKEAVQSAGGYKVLPYLEDYYLWIRLVKDGYILENINDVLVLVRTGNMMFERRGSKLQIRGWYILQKEMQKIKLVKPWEMIRNMICIIGFTYCPTVIRKKLYERILREKWDSDEKSDYI